VSAQKKYWVFRSGIDNAKYASDDNHRDLSCTGCHGGVDGTSDRAAAHAGRAPIPGASKCATCHAAAATLAAGSLHTTLSGYEAILADRGFDLTPGTTSRQRYDAQCTRCHAAVEAPASLEAACGQCHVSVPDTAGGGLVAGHRMRRTPDVVSNCTACHGSRVKDEYFGLNNPLYQRNRQFSASLAAGDPFAGATLQPDVHRTAGMGCDACHTGAEMHGAGMAPGVDRYGVSGRTRCLDCHQADVSAPGNLFHSAGHVQAMACHVCHAQPYKSCFSCHTQETATGAAYFTNNTTDPTRAARYPSVQAAWSATVTYAAGATVSYLGAAWTSLQAANLNHLPDEAASTWWAPATGLAPGDSLMTFRAGRNPKFGVLAGAPRYAVLRHVPVDADTFTYTEEGTPEPGLFTALSARPTWKYATPHNIARLTAITQDPDGAGPLSACGNCHGTGWSAFWLTDPEGDSHGWVPAGSTFEVDANAGVVVGAPLPFSLTP
jgi:hypothetical protein